MDPNLSGTLEIPEGTIFWKLEQADVASTTRPTLVLLHAAVADHTLWDEQVPVLVAKGWRCLRLDLLGFGKSEASSDYLQEDKSTRKPIDYLRYIASVIDHVVGSDQKVILIGLSRGGGFSLDFAVTNEERVAGLAVIAGGIAGFDYPEVPEEEELFKQEEELLAKKDVPGLAQVNVDIWANGPLQKPGRVSAKVAKQIYDWYIDIAELECAGTGGSVLSFESLDPPGIKRLERLNRMPVAIAYGTFDETHTTEAMKHIGKEVPNVNLKEFATGHMVNLEMPEQFNAWLLDWLNSNFS